LCLALAFVSCRQDGNAPQYQIYQPDAGAAYSGWAPGTVPIFDKKPARTIENVEKFNLETPIRCTVDWDSQTLISAQPFERSDFLLERVDKGDKLPAMDVENLSFENRPVDDIVRTLLKNTGIQVYATDMFYKKMTQDEINGDLTKVMDLITSIGGVYYSYDNRTKRLTLRRYAKWNLHVPLSQEVILAVEDALRGADIDDIVIDWEDRLLIFQGDVVTEEKVRAIINKFSLENYLVAFDIDVYRVYPKAADGAIPWMNIIDAFNPGSIKLSQKGIIGRTLVVSSNFNRGSLKEFLYPQANTVLVSSGTFITPDRWQGRFDIGRCSRETRLETDLNVLTESKFTPDKERVGRLDTTVVLRTTAGDIAKYTVPYRLGDNLLVIGIPTQYFAEGTSTPVPPNAELVLLASPRIIKIVKPLKK
jgi:hypothetical protein